MRICIVGAGAIGATIGAKLAATGHSVSLIARGANLAALRTGGLRFVDHVDGRSGTCQLPASESAADFGAQDLVVIGLKAHAIGAMLPKMAPLIGPQTIVVPAINGLPWWYFYREGGRALRARPQGEVDLPGFAGGPGDGERIRALDPEGTMFAALDCRHIIGCVVHIAAESRAPGEVHHTAGRVLILGEPDNSDSERLRALCGALNEAGFEARASTRIRLDVWTKLLGNTSFNPVAALTGYLMNEICADEGVLDVIRAVMREGMAVAQHYGHPMQMTIEQRIGLARQLGAAKISMLQDLEQKRRLELDAIVGSVIELAERAGIAVPATRMLFALAHARAKTLGLA